MSAPETPGDALLELAFAAMGVGVVLLDPHGRAVRVSPRARALLGAGEDEPPGDVLARLRDPQGGGPLAGLVAAALRGEAVSELPLSLPPEDGRARWALASAAPLREAGAPLAGAVLTLCDATSLYERQAHREDLARTISHDLRAPLGVILAQAKLMGRRLEPPEVLRGRVDAIGKSAQRMSAMLTDLVESTLLESGRLRLELGPVDLPAMIRELCGRLPAPHDGRRVRVEAAPGLPKLRGDAERLERVFVNLLTNALKYSAPETEVVVRLAQEDDGVRTDVVDQGQGIAPGDLAQLFERFFRAAGSSRFEGMGLGLYTVRMLVEAHGGKVEASSAAGRGSVFRVWLPLRA